MMHISNRLLNSKWFCNCVYRDEMDINEYFYMFREHFAKQITHDLILSVLEYNYDYNFIKRRKNVDDSKFILLNKQFINTNFPDFMNNTKVSFHTYEMTCNYLDKGKSSINYSDFKNKIKEIFDKYFNNVEKII